MNLTDILAKLPETIVSRFSANSSAFWIKACKDILNDLDGTLCGPWNYKEVRCYPMNSGFFRIPESLEKVIDVCVISGSTFISGDALISDINKSGFSIFDKFSSLIDVTKYDITELSSDDELIVLSSASSITLSAGDWAVSSGVDYDEITLSTSTVLTSTATSFDRKRPGRIFASKPGKIFSSNVFAKGYEKTVKPTSLTEEFSIPDEWDNLIAAGLRYKAEVADSLASSDTIAAGKNYEALKSGYIEKYSSLSQETKPRPFRGVTFSVKDY